MRALVCVLCVMGGWAAEAVSACPAVGVGGCAQTVVAAPAIVAAPVIAVPSIVTTTFAVPTVITAPAVVQQNVFVRQRPVRVRSRTVIRSRGFGLGIF